ncbi:hypothetical protein ACTZWW_01865 [Salinarimonas sp. NSM]|uniref:hypothetical protein n=1 Tax=Salinarimonas sp. NSM TaxID=3458003 RepID=UPI0040359D3B
MQTDIRYDVGRRRNSDALILRPSAGETPAAGDPRDGGAAANGLIVLERLFQRPIITVNEMALALNVSYAAANQIVQRLAVAGILEEITGQRRNRVYRYTPYVDLFTERGAISRDDEDATTLW